MLNDAPFVPPKPVTKVTTTTRNMDFNDYYVAPEIRTTDSVKTSGSNSYHYVLNAPTMSDMWYSGY